MANVCPSCGIISPPETNRCDCGYDLTKSIKSKENTLDIRLRVAKEYFKYGLVFFVSAMGILFLSIYAASPDGGVVYIQVGSIVVGVLSLSFSIFEYVRVKDISRELKTK